MYLGDGDSSTLDETYQAIVAAQSPLVQSTSYYIGRLASDDPEGYAQLQPRLNDVLASLNAWKAKYRALAVVKGKSYQDQWDGSAAALDAAGKDLLAQMAKLNHAAVSGDRWAVLLGTMGAIVSIGATTAAVEIPRAFASAAAATGRAAVGAVKAGYSAGASAVRTVAGDVGSVFGGLENAVVSPIKGPLIAIGIGAAVLGLVYLYSVTPKARTA